MSAVAKEEYPEVAIGHDMQDAIMAKRPKNHEAIVVMFMLPSYTLPATCLTEVNGLDAFASDIGLTRAELDAALAWLEEVRAVAVRGERVYVNPHGIYRGDFADHHLAAAEWAELFDERT